MFNVEHLAYLGIFTAAMMWAAHWFPVRPKGVAAYIYGTGVIVIVSIFGILRLPEISPVAMILTVAGSAGLATFAAYGIDHFNEQRHQLADAQERAEYVATLTD